MMETALDRVTRGEGRGGDDQEGAMDLLQLDDPLGEQNTLKVLQTLSLAVSRAPELVAYVESGARSTAEYDQG
jgi:hypothetical protein